MDDSYSVHYEKKEDITVLVIMFIILVYYSVSYMYFE